MAVLVYKWTKSLGEIRDLSQDVQGEDDTRCLGFCPVWFQVLCSIIFIMWYLLTCSCHTGIKVTDTCLELEWRRWWWKWASEAGPHPLSNSTHLSGCLQKKNPPPPWSLCPVASPVFYLRKESIGKTPPLKSKPHLHQWEVKRPWAFIWPLLLGKSIPSSPGRQGAPLAQLCSQVFSWWRGFSHHLCQ